MDEKAWMIRGDEGGCWLQTVDEQGRRWSSYVGKFGRAAVETWCAEHGVEFYQMKPSAGQKGHVAAAGVIR